MNNVEVVFFFVGRSNLWTENKKSPVTWVYNSAVIFFFIQRRFPKIVDRNRRRPLKTRVPADVLTPRRSLEYVRPRDSKRAERRAERFLIDLRKRLLNLAQLLFRGSRFTRPKNVKIRHRPLLQCRTRGPRTIWRGRRQAAWVRNTWRII